MTPRGPVSHLQTWVVENIDLLLANQYLPAVRVTPRLSWSRIIKLSHPELSKHRAYAWRLSRYFWSHFMHLQETRQLPNHREMLDLAPKLRFLLRCTHYSETIGIFHRPDAAGPLPSHTNLRFTQAAADSAQPQEPRTVVGRAPSPHESRPHFTDETDQPGDDAPFFSEPRTGITHTMKADAPPPERKIPQDLFDFEDPPRQSGPEEDSQLAPDIANTRPATNPRTIHMVMSAVGYVGKTFICRLLAEYLKAPIYDAEPESYSSLIEFKDHLDILRFEDPSSFFETCLANPRRHVILDVGTSGYMPLLRCLETTDALHVLADHGVNACLHTIVCGGGEEHTTVKKRNESF